MPGIIKERLFTPGPTPLLMEAQLRALTMTLHHRTDAFRALMRETLDNLKYYFNTKNDVIVFASSGTGAMEGAVSNLLSPGDRVLIGTAGKFGERWVQLAKAYGIESVVVEAPYGQPVPVGEMKKHLESSGAFRAVFIQATESSTGVRNDVESLGKAVSALPDCCFVVDAITGLGTTDLRPDEWGIDIMIGGSQKATMIPPGLAFASISDKAAESHGEIEAAALLLRLREGTQEPGQGRVQLHAGDFAGRVPARGAELHQGTGARKPDRQRRAAGRGYARSGRRAGADAILRWARRRMR